MLDGRHALLTKPGVGHFAEGGFGVRQVVCKDVCVTEGVVGEIVRLMVLYIRFEPADGVFVLPLFDLLFCGGHCDGPSALRGIVRSSKQAQARNGGNHDDARRYQGADGGLELCTSCGGPRPTLAGRAIGASCSLEAAEYGLDCVPHFLGGLVAVIGPERGRSLDDVQYRL